MEEYKALKATIEEAEKRRQRRTQVLRLIMAGQSDEEIAQSMGITEGTARKQCSNLYEDFKLPKNSRKQLIELFAKHSPQLIQDGKNEYVPYKQLPPPEPPPFPLVGCLQLDSPYYVGRSIDETVRNLFSEHKDSSSLCFRITGAKGMGKSSLLVRLRQYLEQTLNHCVVSINLNGTEFGREGLENFNTLLYRFTYSIARAFRPAFKGEPPALKTKWDDTIIPGLNSTDYLEDYVFSQILGTKTLIIDGIDAILEHESSYAQFSEFLRYWYENKMKQVSAAKIVWPHIVIAYSTEPYANFQSPVGSPLQNVGIALKLPELTPQEVQLQARRYGLQWNEDTVTRVMDWVGGHPDLINRTLYRMTSEDRTSDQIDGFFKEVIDEKDREFDDYLLKHLKLFQDNQKLAGYFIKTLKQEEWRDEFARFQLEKSGLVKIEGDRLRARFKLYQEYFTKHLAVDCD